MDLPVAILDRLDEKFQGIEGKGRSTSAPENGADADCGAGSRLQQVEPGVPHWLALYPRSTSFVATRARIF